MTTRVIHIKAAPPNRTDWPADYVFIGRPSRWGNPFRLTGEFTRESCIVNFDSYLQHRMDLQPELHASIVSALRGKTLVCYCAPKACHGDVLARIADQDPESPEAVPDVAPEAPSG